MTLMTLNNNWALAEESEQQTLLCHFTFDDPKCSSHKHKIANDNWPEWLYVVSES